MKIARLLVGDVFVYAQKKDDKFYLIEGDIFSEFTVTDVEVLGELSYPVEPSKIVALGANYKKHIGELKRSVSMQKVVEEKKEPLLFLKPSSALIANGETIVLPKNSENVHYEGELAIVISKKCKKVAEADVKDYILGYTIANDVSDRTLQNLDIQWTRAKGFDTFCPLGDVIETELDAPNARIKTTLNGVVVQDGNADEMINRIDYTVAFVSNIMTLNAGDIILTGTPAGVGKLSDGDTCVIEIEGIGSLTNNVVKEI